MHVAKQRHRGAEGPDGFHDTAAGRGEARAPAFLPWGLLRSGWGTCLACFLWIEQVRHSEREKKDILSGKLAEGRYVHTRRALIDMEQLFWSYWKDRGARSIMV
jgi:hypothetical protein